jgi:DNA polymerase-3 subunit delta'
MSDLPKILGHERILAHLREVASADRLHHAYLFEGPAGVGKRLTAQWLSLMVNCTDPDEAMRPCGRCHTCRTILAGNHPDVSVVEPDPTKASARISVAAIREVIRRTGYHRYGARRRVVLVDPAEAMAAPAANALLKTLEEPPDGTGFVLIATHADSLLPTILSRCQRIRFGPVPTEQLVPWLAERGIDDPEATARLSGGCPGVALSMSDGQLETRIALRGELFQALGGDLGSLFGWTEKLTKGKRADWRRRVDEVLDLVEELLRDTVVASQDGERPLLHADAASVTKAWSRALWPSGVVVCARAVDDARADLDANVSGRNALDSLLTVLATELGRARTAGMSQS